MNILMKKGEIRIMDKELENLLDNYENVIYGQTFPINPSIHQLHLLLDYIANLEQQCKKQKEVIDKATNELFILKDMIYKPETREENFEIQRKISSIIKRLNGKEASK